MKHERPPEPEQRDWRVGVVLLVAAAVFLAFLGFAVWFLLFHP